MKNYKNGDSIILLLYVDDILIARKNKMKIDALKKVLNKSFAMNDLGPLKKILGMKTTRVQSRRMLWISPED